MMRKLWGYVRGALGMGITWAAAWSLSSVVFSLTGLFGDLAPMEYLVFAGVLAVLGFIGGVAFSAVLSLTDGRRRFDQLSIARFALWGALGGIVMQLPSAVAGDPTNPATWGFFALLGAGSAAGSLILARKAEQGELLREAEAVAEVGLSESEAQRLLD